MAETFLYQSLVGRAGIVGLARHLSIESRGCFRRSEKSRLTSLLSTIMMGRTTIRGFGGFCQRGRYRCFYS